MENSIHIYRSNHLEQLLEKMAAVVSIPPPSPFAPECIVVQSRGMATWINMELSRRFGVWANPFFPHPRQFLQLVLGAVLGEQGNSGQNFTRERLTFAVLELLPSLLPAPEFGKLRSYLGVAAESKRLHLARRLAYVFDQYMIYRPELLLAWEEKERGGVPLGEEDRWQPLLWQAIVDHLQAPSPVRLLHEALQALAGGALRHPELLPSRVSFFGIVSLPRIYLRLFSRLAACCPVHFFLTAPTSFYWGDIRSKREILRGRGRTGAEDSAGEGHPLLASCGALARDFQDILEEEADYLETEDDLFVGLARPGTLLEQLQDDILQMRCRGDGPQYEPPLPFPAGDNSLEIHACHSMLRELEVLQDHLLSLLSGPDPCLPHEILVMTPAIAGYAPLIAAVFDRDPADSRFIPYHVADRSESCGALVIEAFFALLSLMRSRFRLSAVLSLLEYDAVRNRFAIGSADLPGLRDWLIESGIRWGIDEEHRALQGQPDDRQNTWRFGLDRLLLGYAMPLAGGRTFCDILPCDVAEGKDADLLGSFLHFAETLFSWRRLLVTDNPISRWQEMVNELLEALLAPGPEETGQLEKIRRAMAELAAESREALYAGPMTLQELESLLREKLTAAIGPYGFLEGGVTFCEMLPMRSIPCRVVCILGMNDGAFPRERDPLSFDLMARFPQKGDRSPRSDDLYLFLASLLSARQKLWISYVGFSSKDNAGLPPSVVVDELLDCISETFHVAGANAADRRRKVAGLLVTSHPLQPMSIRYFDGSDPRLFSFAGQYCRAAGQAPAPEGKEALFFDRPLGSPAPEMNRLQLSELQRFFYLPARWFLQKQLNLYIAGPEDEPEERLPFFPAGLEKYRLRDDLLWQRDMAADESYTLLRGQGRLPAGGMGSFVFRQLQEAVTPLARQLGELTAAARLPDLVTVYEQPGSWTMAGDIGGRYRLGLVRAVSGKASATFLLKAWLEHLFLCAVSPADQAPITWLIFQGEDGQVELRRFVAAGAAAELLADLTDLFVKGQRAPLLFFPKASYAFAAAMKADAAAGKGDNQEAALEKARKAFFGDKFSQARFEGDSPSVRQLWGDRNPLAHDFLFQAGASAGSFAELSLRVYLPLLDGLEVVP